MADSLSGRIIHDYEILEPVGRGGYGTVYRARQLSVAREVAIKVISEKHTLEGDHMQRFESEARIIARLEHPHIVPLYDYWRDAEGAFLVMRYLRGGSVGELVERHGALSLAQTARILEQIGDALAIAHQEGVIHRDIKPDNILRDERDNVYLGDFGVAKLLQGDADLTETDSFVGTPAYLSPEQIQTGHATPQSDMYSLGIVLYELLTGEHPFVSEGLMIVMKHLQELVPSLVEKRPDLPVEIDAVIQKATAKEPAERYATMRDLLFAFREGMQLATPSSTPIVKMSDSPTQQLTTQRTRAFPKPSTGDRNRRSMLQNVYAFWVEGLLTNSLHDMTLLDVGMTQRADVVDNPWDVLLMKPGAADETLSAETSILDVFDRLNGKLLILGAPGSGKTTTLLDLARDLLFRAGVDEEHAIPAVFNLSSWSENAKPLAEWLVDELGSKYLVPKQIAQMWVDKNELLLLLDGLDEVNAAKRAECVRAINTFRGEHGFVDVVVCSRTDDYAELTEQLKLNGGVVLQPLTYEQVDAYLDSFGEGMKTVREMMSADETLWEMSRTPLMLSIIVMAYHNFTPDSVPALGDAETQRRNLFDVYVQRMFARRLELHTGEQPDGFQPETISKMLGWLARRMVEHTQSVFLIENIQPAWLTSALREQYFDRYVWFHSVSQALAWGGARLLLTPTGIIGTGVVNGIAWGIAGAVWGWVLSTDRWRKRRWIALAGGAFGVAVGADAVVKEGMAQLIQMPIGAILYMLLMVGAVFQLRRIDYRRDVIQPLERLRFSRKAVKVWMVVLSAFLGMLATFLNAGTAGVTEFEAVPTILGVVGGVLSGGLTGFITSGFASDRVGRTTRPNEGMYRSLSNFTGMGLIVAVLFLLVVVVSVAPLTSIAFGVVQGIIAAVPFGYNAGLTFGGLPVIQHVILRTVLQRGGIVPQNIARILDESAALILLRKVGGGYIFIHRYLLEYFAERESKRA